MSADGASVQRQTGISSTWIGLSAHQRLTALAIILGVGLTVHSIGIERRARLSEVVRRQFHLAQAIPFAAFSISDSKKRWPILTGTVRFSDTQYRAYVGSLDDRRVWESVPLEFRGVNLLEGNAPEAFCWRSDPPAPRYAGDRLGRWGHASMPRIYELKDARYYCFGVMKIAPSADREASRYRAVACHGLVAEDEPIAIVKGALDDETRTLHWILM